MDDETQESSMWKQNLMVGSILLIGVAGCLYMLSGVFMTGWLHTATLDEHRQSRLQTQMWIWLSVSIVWLLGSWAVAWWVLKIGCKKENK